VSTLLRVFAWFVISSQLASAQWMAPTLEISGQPGQPFVCMVRYYDQTAAKTTTITRGEIPRSQPAVAILPLDAGPLAAGHAGMRVAVAASGYDLTQVTLLDGDDELATSERNTPGMIILSTEKVPADAGFPDLSPFPNATDHKFLSRFLTAVERGDAHLMVSDLPLANIDGPVFQAYLLALREAFGPLQLPAADRLAGEWLTWDGNLEARVYAGRLRFDHGECTVRMMTIDGKLVDFEPSAPELPADWLQQLPTREPYEAQGQALLHGLLAGQAMGSQLLFSRKYQPELTIEKVATLSNELREKYGTAITSSRVIAHQLEDIVLAVQADESEAAVAPDKRLAIDYLLTLDSGKQCIGRVSFIIPTGRDLVSRAHLQSVFVTESLPSAYPQKARLLKELLGQLMVSSPDDAAVTWHAQWDTTVGSLQTTQQLARFLEQLLGRAGKPAKAPQLELWSFTEGAKQTTSGPLAMQDGSQLQVTAHWLENRLYGMTFVGPNVAMSTLDILPPWADSAEANTSGPSASNPDPSTANSPAAHATRFWKALLSGDAPSAHALLGPVFRKSVSVQDLEAMVAVDPLPPAGNGEQPVPAGLQELALDSVRLQARDGRSSAIAIGVYHLASFADDSYLPVYCEYAYGLNAANQPTFELQAFSAENDATYPVIDHSQATRFADWFMERRIDTLIERLPAHARATADPRLLTLFMESVLETLGESPQLSPQVTAIRRIEQGQSRLDVSGRLRGGLAEIPFSATFERELLLEFDFEHPAMYAFAARMQDFSPIDERLERFIHSWHDSSKLLDSPQRLAGLLGENLRTQPALDRLGQLQHEYQLTSGDLQGMSIQRHAASPNSNEIAVDVRVRFEQGEELFRITFAINAITAWITGIEIIEKVEAR
jgi:hypothetical protein